MILLGIWLCGALFVTGLLLGLEPPNRDGEGYQLILVALVWPVVVVLRLYYRLSNWVRCGKDDW